MGSISLDTLANGALLAVAGIIIASLRNLPFKVAGMIKRATVVTLVVDSRSDLFAWLIAYFNDLPYSRNCRLITASSRPDALGTKDAPAASSALLITPAPGFHIFFHRRRVVWVTRELSTGQQVIETVKVSTPGFSRDYLNEVLTGCIDRVRAASVGRTALYVMDRWAENWVLASHRRKRPLGSVVLDGEAEQFRDDVAQFMRSEDWYASRGIPWRRGYLLYGPPGTGKTSLVFAVAGDLDMSLCMISLCDARLSDHNFSTLLQRTPPRSMIVIEDVDAFFNQRAKQESDVKLSFSGFLNALDGVHSQEGRIIVLTTNHADRLDAALIRPGRIDTKMHLGHASRSQARRMYLQFFPGDDEGAKEFTARLGDSQVTTAQLQEMLVNSDAERLVVHE